MENQRIITDYRFSISANSICVTEVAQWLGDDLKKNRTKQNANLLDNRTKGILSQKNIKRLKKAVNWLVISTQPKKVYSLKQNQKTSFKVNFITLTIPPQSEGGVTEKQFKTLLNTWLTYHRKYNNLNNYVWKIETHKDGRFHIHLTTDTYIWMEKVRNSWNMILKRNGMLEHHFEKFGNYNPPSTEIKAVNKVKKLAAYMAKYMTKNNKENPMFSGRVWGCSMKISKVLANHVYICPTEIFQVTKPIFEKGIKCFEVFTEKNVFGNCYKVADIYLMSVIDWIDLQGSYLGNLFKEIILFLRKETAREQQLKLQLT